MSNFIESLLPPVVLGLLGYYAITRLLGTSGDLGNAFSQWLQTNTQTAGGALTGPNIGITGLRNLLQGNGLTFTFVGVPSTPAGNLPSNWTWQGPNNTMIGLPAGMTFADFCAVSSNSPMCQPGYWGL